MPGNKVLWESSWFQHVQSLVRPRYFNANHQFFLCRSRCGPHHLIPILFNRRARFYKDFIGDALHVNLLGMISHQGSTTEKATVCLNHTTYTGQHSTSYLGYSVLLTIHFPQASYSFSIAGSHNLTRSPSLGSIAVRN